MAREDSMVAAMSDRGSAERAEIAAVLTRMEATLDREAKSAFDRYRETETTLARIEKLLERLARVTGIEQ